MNFSIYNRVMTELQFPKLKNGQLPVHMALYSMHGFVSMKRLNAKAIQHDIDASFSGEHRFKFTIDIHLNNGKICTFHRYSLLTQNGTGYEIFVDNNGRLIVGILTKKEYFATSVSSPFLIDKK